jgi:hypothetical protein
MFTIHFSEFFRTVLASPPVLPFNNAIEHFTFGDSSVHIDITGRIDFHDFSRHIILNVYCENPYNCKCDDAWNCEDIFNEVEEDFLYYNTDGDSKLDIQDDMSAEIMEVYSSCDINMDGAITKCEMFDCIVEW